MFPLAAVLVSCAMNRSTSHQGLASAAARPAATKRALRRKELPELRSSRRRLLEWAKPPGGRRNPPVGIVALHLEVPLEPDQSPTQLSHPGAPLCASLERDAH
jgi:hypothetical protein